MVQRMAITTVKQLLQAGDIGRCELVRGKLAMMMLPGGRHGKLANLIAHRLTAFVTDRHAGTILAETGFVLSRDPDTGSRSARTREAGTRFGMSTLRDRGTEELHAT